MKLFEANNKNLEIEDFSDHREIDEMFEFLCIMWPSLLPPPISLFSFFLFPASVPIHKDWSYPNTVPYLIFVLYMMIEIQIHNNNAFYITSEQL